MRCPLASRFGSTLRTLSRDRFFTPGQDCQERVRYATECWFRTLDRQHVSSSFCEEWENAFSHVRCQLNRNDTRWFNSSWVTLCKSCSDSRWLWVKRDDRRSLDDLPKMINGLNFLWKAEGDWPQDPSSLVTIPEGDGSRQALLGVDIWVCLPFGRVLLDKILPASPEKVSYVAVTIP